MNNGVTDDSDNSFMSRKRDTTPACIEEIKGGEQSWSGAGIIHLEGKQSRACVQSSPFQTKRLSDRALEWMSQVGARIQKMYVRFRLDFIVKDFIAKLPVEHTWDFQNKVFDAWKILEEGVATFRGTENDNANIFNAVLAKQLSSCSDSMLLSMINTSAGNIESKSCSPSLLGIARVIHQMSLHPSTERFAKEIFNAPENKRMKMLAQVSDFSEKMSIKSRPEFLRKINDHFIELCDLPSGVASRLFYENENPFTEKGFSRNAKKLTEDKTACEFLAKLQKIEKELADVEDSLVNAIAKRGKALGIAYGDGSNDEKTLAFKEIDSSATASRLLEKLSRLATDKDHAECNLALDQAEKELTRMKKITAVKISTDMKHKFYC